MNLVKNKWCRQTLPKTSQGFSLIELIVALAVALVLAAIAIPSITTTYGQYRLGVQATLIANQLDLLRMTAVRKNTTITLYSNLLTSGCATPNNSNVVLYIDVDKGGACDSKDPQLVLPADMQISNGLSTAPTGMPGVTSMGPIYSSAVKLQAAGISFSSNGTISNGAGPYIIVIGYTATSKYGFRAITVTPMGQIKVWTASASGSWGVTS